MNRKTTHGPLPTIRNYHFDDLEHLRRLKIELEKRDPAPDPWSLQGLEGILSLPNRLLESNAFVAELKETLLAFLKLKLELDIGRAVLVLVVHPHSWDKGVLLSLIQRAVMRARELEAKRVHINVRSVCPELKSVLLKLGFRSIRRYIELRLDLSKAPIPDAPRKVVHIRFFKRGEDDRLAWIQNRAFGGSWGYSSNTVQDITDRTALPRFSPRNVLFAFDGERLVGHCWTMITPSQKFPYRSSGRIFMIGVDPEYRGRGIGKQLLLAGLSYLKRRGIHGVDLTVDSQNKAAYNLYRSVGFRHQTSTLWYEVSLT